MSKFPTIGAFLSIIVCIISITFALNYRKAVYKVLQERRAEYAVNFAADAAVDSIVGNSTDLGLDYSTGDSIAAGPNVALETFLQVFCKNYGFALTEESYAVIKNDYLPMFMVAVYDGYYIAEQHQISQAGGHDLVFSLKQPYLYEDTTGIYGLNLGGLDAKKFKSSVIQKVDAPISQEHQSVVINTLVSDTIVETVCRHKEGQLQTAFYLPSSATSIVNTNPIKGVTVMAYVEGIDVGYGRSSDVFGIGGARVTKATYCIAYVRNGQKLYTYEHLVPTGVTKEATFTSPQEAAAAGYYFDNTTISAE